MPRYRHCCAGVRTIGSDDGLHAIVAYTHDLLQPGGAKAGNLFYEMNRQLRDRTTSGRQLCRNPDRIDDTAQIYNSPLR